MWLHIDDRWYVVNFTFQSGYIQIVFLSPIPPTTNIFTFQSGYIQIRIDRIIGLTGTLLHSNLVIFKSEKKEFTAGQF